MPGDIRRPIAIRQQTPIIHFRLFVIQIEFYRSAMSYNQFRRSNAVNRAVNIRVKNFQSVDIYHKLRSEQTKIEVC